jgi:hypothetical protein
MTVAQPFTKFKKAVSFIRLTALPTFPDGLPSPLPLPASPSTIYQSRSTHFASNKQKLEKVANTLAVLRLILFILLGFLIYLALGGKSPVMLLAAALDLAGFLFLVRAAVINRQNTRYLDLLRQINDEEKQAVGGDFSAFDPGDAYVDYHHDFSFDLDIFGQNSLFRMINRTATPAGHRFLADQLMNPAVDAGAIRQRQQAVKELCDRLDWRQHFLATARDSAGNRSDGADISSWLQSSDRFRNSLFFRFAILVNVLITTTLTAWLILPYLLPAGLIPVLPLSFLTYFIFPVSLVIARARTINREQEKLENLVRRLRRYGGLLRQIERESFSSPELVSLQDSLKTGLEPASLVMKRLTDILWGLETRGNMIVSFLLNAYLLWDIRVMIRLENWRSKYRHSFDAWIRTIAEFETLNSLANLAYNRSDLTWPEILDGEFRMTIVEGGHPLIPPERRVDNSLEFVGPNRIFLITGANMSGKSTLLRMTGVNMILAMCGGPVCARHLSLVPVSLQTSVRTHDSLGDDESYFYAELKKLGRIIRRIEQGHSVFVIIDEMLKGTNSHDKHTGSAALIRKLIGLGTSGLVATHDVELGELEKEFTGRLVNRCFEVISTGDQLQFDYLLHPGVSKNLNATFLMKQMGII